MTTKSIKWILSNGKAVEIIVCTAPELYLNGNERTDGSLRIDTSMTIDGRSVTGWVIPLDAPAMIGDVEVVARWANIAIRADTYAEYVAAVSACKADADYVAHIAKQDAGYAVAAAHAAHMARVDKMMGE